jgi:hypothetical protein
MFKHLDFLKEKFVFPRLKSSNLSVMNGPSDAKFKKNGEETVKKIERIWLEFGPGDMKQFKDLYGFEDYSWLMQLLALSRNV